MNLLDKNIIITGASGGIGYQLSKDLIKEGANLALLARRKKVLVDLAEELKPSSKIITYYCDVTSRESVKAAFDFARKEFGIIDIVILNAGASYRMSVEEFNPVILEEIVNVNLMGMINCLNEIIPEFIRRKGG